MKYTLSFLLAISALTLFAQNVGIGTTMPDSSALLELHSNDKGVLVPRMSSSQRKAISQPAEGLMVFDTTTGSFWYCSVTQEGHRYSPVFQAIQRQLSDCILDSIYILYDAR